MRRGILLGVVAAVVWAACGCGGAENKLTPSSAIPPLPPKPGAPGAQPAKPPAPPPGSGGHS